MEPQNNPYDFLADSPVKKTRFTILNGGSKKQRLLQIAVIAGIILVVFSVAFLILQSGSKKGADQLYQLSASQQDIIDLITYGSASVRDPKLINTSATTNIIIASQANDISSYMSKNGMKNAKKIKAYRNSQYKKVLDEAKANGNFDETYKGVLANRLDAYRTLLRSVYASTDSVKLKKITSNESDQLSIVMSDQVQN